jgi:ATP-dependent RNA helicase RhlE
MTLFSDLGLIEPLFRAVAAQGYTTPTPIQAQAIPRLLEGRDVLGIAQTGTGKTAAFALPMLQHLAQKNKKPSLKGARTLILTPTRELAVQIADDFAVYGKHMNHLKRTIIHGGVSQGPQVSAIASGTDVLIATPGRLLDLINQRRVDLATVEIFVLDEADRMLDMGFIRDVQKIVRTLPKDRQTLLFSATMPDAVGDLVKTLLRNPERIEVTPPSTTVERIAQKVMFVSRENKRHLLADLLKGNTITRAIVFTRTKHSANRVAEQLQKGGFQADAIHGNKSQNARQRSLNSFKEGKVRVLVATDIAARGIDVDGVSHVINFEMPVEPESYVHRIGRTARAGNDGIAISFCDREEMSQLRAIERQIRQPVPVDEAHAYHAAPGQRGPRQETQDDGDRPRGQRPQGHKPNGHNGNGPKKPGRNGRRGGSGGRPWENRSQAA